jgi:hypothetical protein
MGFGVAKGAPPVVLAGVVANGTALLWARPVNWAGFDAVG